ncbi:bZIP transcription factor [Sporobolomyces koalae]|uniref:bZIP transcription factor n=1 Tax=Sporobolomyces koalae TaxID=500713 RepID=UPI00317D43E1
MNHTWAFNQLNQLTPSPGISPSNGPVKERDELTLSFPCDGNALQAQLEQWTNVAFDFDSPDFGSDPAPMFDDHSKALSTGSGESLFGAVHNSAIPPNALQHSASSTESASTVDLSALLAPSLSSHSTGSPFTGSLVDPALALPHLHDASAALPVAFFASPSSAFDTSALPTDASSVVVEPELAPSPAVSTSSASKGKKTAAAPKKKRASVADKAKALPLPEGVNTDGMTEEQLNALAIEEDKRRRNTAASARFRVKKKQRESALEQTAKELRDRVAALEKDVESLRTENGWLRGLITDKTVLGGKDGASNNKKRLREDDESEFSSSVVLV